MKIVQINSIVNSGSTGRIAEDIGRVMMANGYESVIAYGRFARLSDSRLLKIGSKADVISHGIRTLLLDEHGFGSRRATLDLIETIKIEKPDVIGLHNLHGYYINIEELFVFLKQAGVPIVWTLFDCWAFTGHCSYFDSIGCNKWQSQCFACPKYNKYPASLFRDNSKENFNQKKTIFSDVPNLTIVVHSDWLKQLVAKSFLQNYPIIKIHSGIDLERFAPQQNLNKIKLDLKLGNSIVILGVASLWDERKGLGDFIKLSCIIEKNQRILLVGLTKKQIQKLPKNIIGISRTENVEDLAQIYSLASVFVNPTWQDNFPTTNIEALACGTPVITYNTGGSPESIDDETGLVVEKGDINGLLKAINTILCQNKTHYSDKCRRRAEKLYNKDDRYKDYIKIFESLISIAEY